MRGAGRWWWWGGPVGLCTALGPWPWAWPGAACPPGWCRRPASPALPAHPPMAGTAAAEDLAANPLTALA